MAAKNNLTESAIDKTSFFWLGLCGVCHPGGGPGEFDRDGKRYFDETTGKFGYESLGKVAADVRLDGDYAHINTANGELGPARWDLTGVAETDCLMCHRSDIKVQDGKQMNWIWRAATLRAKTALKDGSGNTVPAYASAAAAGQGWFSSMQLTTVPAGTPPLASKLQLDYSKGVADGSLVADAAGNLKVSHHIVTGKPKDYACWGCHSTPDQKKRGRVWFNKDQDVHYAYFNRLHDTDSANDIPPTSSTACTQCHGAGLDHHFRKGRSMDGSVRDELDYAGFQSCKDCHDPASPTKHPDAPAPSNSSVHTIGKHQDVLSCEACHIPYRTLPAELAIDNATTGSTISYNTDAFLSADPLVPTSSDRSKWYPTFKLKTSKEGRIQLFPLKMLLSAWWGDWDRKGTDATNDDIIAPIPLWRIRGVTAGKPLTGTADANGDGKAEVNTLAEIRAYLTAMKRNDRYGRPVAVNPVLVKGGTVYFEDAGQPSGVGHFELESSGIRAESSHPFGESHNVLAASKALGSRSCGECHRSMNGGRDTQVFDRKVLVDTFGVDGAPVYRTIRQVTGIDPQ